MSDPSLVSTAWTGRSESTPFGCFCVIGLLVGPTLVMGALGYYQLAAKTFGVMAGIGVFVVFVYHEASEVDDAELPVLGGGNVFVTAGILFVCRYLLDHLLGWLLSLLHSFS